jgi:predicted membrane channel-forming protein YqfA (hemolysin III family)
VLVYVCSTLYHSFVRTRARHVLQIIGEFSASVRRSEAVALR